MTNTENNIKKFEGFLDRIQGLLDDAKKQGHIIVRVEDLENAFPELREREDERIRKSLIDFFDSANQVGENPMYEYGIQTDKIIKYIEKQVSPNMVADAYLRGCNDTEKKWFEKQGEQKPVMEGTFVNVDEVRDDFMQEVYRVLDADSTNDRANQIIDAFDNLPTVTIEKQGEQNPIDKVGPKFHEGEWVVFNNKHQSIYQVEKIENGYYILRHTHGGSFRVCVLHDESLRLWTIKDAEDGDILVIEETETTYKTIFVFKEIEDTHIIHYVYHLNTGIEQVFEKRSANGFVGFIDEVVHPATKEQRDTLLKAIKDADYEFDFMKKELKKIAKPNFNIGDTIVQKHNPTTNKIYFTITDITGGKYWYNDRIICDIAEQDEWEVLEQKAWSEEDEEELEIAIETLHEAGQHSSAEWLKSLKQRIGG